MATESEKRGTTQIPRSPVNPRDTQTVPDFSGFVIIRLLPGMVSKSAESLDAVARDFKLDRLATLLKRYKCPSRRLITSVSVDQLRTLEECARDKGFAPRYSLASYWRLDCREVLETDRRDVLKQFLELHDEVDFAYLEKSASAPASPATNPFEPEQLYLNEAPTGINARWAWTQAGGDGTGMHFIDLEEGWFLSHEDLPKGIQVIFNDNSGSLILRDHGTAVLGEIAGLDNDRGIVGIAPGASVRVVSHFEAAGGTNGHVADAIYAALWANPPPHVLLLEVQRGKPELPTEIDDADFYAIQYAVAIGVIVIEAAGNGGFDLDRWVDDDGLNRMNPTSRDDFRDSGAILVGAASSSTPHQPLPTSNYGSRVDCYGWGEDIVSTGYGDRNPSNQNDNERYTKIFGLTSGASPIIAGAALLVQGAYSTKTGGLLLSPEEMRTILSDPATGTPKGARTVVGVMPDLQEIIPKL